VSAPLYERLRDAIRAGLPVALATVIEGPPDRMGAKLLVGPLVSGEEPAVAGTLGDPALDRVVARDSLGELEAGRSGTRHYGLAGEARQQDLSVFVESFAPPPHMVIFGAVDFTASLLRVAKLLGFRVTVCDARAVFATRQRFPLADEVIVDWPNRYLEKIGPDLGPRDAVCVLTHDAKFDVPALVSALATRAGTSAPWVAGAPTPPGWSGLREAGVDDAGLARIMSPIGLDLGARTPEETAISICAEIIALRTGRRPPSLRDADGPVHAPR